MPVPSDAADPVVWPASLRRYAPASQKTMKSKLHWLSALAAAALLQGCATTHLIHWSKGETSVYKSPPASTAGYTRSWATVVAFPVAVVFDVVAFPFQYPWGVYPYGNVVAPAPEEGR